MSFHPRSPKARDRGHPQRGHPQRGLEISPGQGATRLGWTIELIPFEDGGGAHSSADTHGDHSVACFAAVELGEEGGGEFGSGAAEGVAECDGSAVDVDDGGVEPEGADDGEGLGGEGFVELDD